MTWTAKNNGLTGSALNVNYIFQHPNSKQLSSQNHILYIATDDGIYESTNGGDNWTKFNLPDPSNGEFSDIPAATIGELTFHWFASDPRILNVFYALGAKDSVSRLWIYKSTDAGETWTSRGVVAV